MIRTLTCVAAVLLSVSAAAAQQRGTFIGPQGQFEGSYNTFGNTTTFTSPTGQYQGSATTFGSTTTFTGPTGDYQGSVTQFPSTGRRPRFGF